MTARSMRLGFHFDVMCLAGDGALRKVRRISPVDHAAGLLTGAVVSSAVHGRPR